MKKPLLACLAVLLVVLFAAPISAVRAISEHIRLIAGEFKAIYPKSIILAN